VIETVAEHSAGRASVLAGAGSCSTAEALRLTRTAAEAGADGALVVAPYYNRPAQDGLYAHYSRLADGSPVPLVLYNVPARTGCHLEPETIERLAHHDQIVAIKEASGSLDQASEIILRTNLTVLCSNDSLAVPMLALGAEGVVSVVANIVPKEMIALVEAVQQEDLTRARHLHGHLFPLCQALMNLAPNPVAVKTALALIGQGNGELRLPLIPPELRVREKLSVALSLFGLRVQEPGAGA
jgi:4-hydroxy-tetrahydrodipicolinate synthase